MMVGKMYVSDGVMSTIPIKEVYRALVKFELLDFGDIDDQTRQVNTEGMIIKGRVVGLYTTAAGDRFYIQLEAGHETTTAFLPEEY